MGIGADDIFVFVDAWKQSKYEKDPKISGSIEGRLEWTYRRAGGAMLVTSITDACKLKIDYNLPPDFEYPKLELREEIRSEKERLRADNLMWEQQNSALEAERTNLLQALRTQAQLSSVKGFKEFGLNAEQIVQLNYFATQLKKGVNASDINLPQDNKSRQVIRERDTLKEQLRRTEIKLEMYQVVFNI